MLDRPGRKPGSCEVSGRITRQADNGQLVHEMVVNSGDVPAGEVGWVADLLTQATDPVYVDVVVGGVGADAPGIRGVAGK
jgi:hypothetical protein